MIGCLRVKRSIFLMSNLALYGYCMMLDTPTGIPFFYEKMENGSYSKQLATSRKDYSAQALDFINWISFDPKFRKSASQFYTCARLSTGRRKLQHLRVCFESMVTVRPLKANFASNSMAAENG